MSITRSKIFGIYYLAKQRFAAFIFSLVFTLYFKLYLASIILANCLAWALAIVIYRQSQENTLILHYNVDFGIDYIAEIWHVFLLPVSGLIVNLVNILLVSAIQKYRQDKLLFHLIFAGALLVNLTILAALWAIYMINFR